MKHTKVKQNELEIFKFFKQGIRKKRECGLKIGDLNIRCRGRVRDKREFNLKKKRISKR